VGEGGCSFHLFCSLYESLILLQLYSVSSGRTNNNSNNITNNNTYIKSLKINLILELQFFFLRWITLKLKTTDSWDVACVVGWVCFNWKSCLHLPRRLVGSFISYVHTLRLYTPNALHTCQHFLVLNILFFCLKCHRSHCETLSEYLPFFFQNNWPISTKLTMKIVLLEDKPTSSLLMKNK